MLYPSLNKLLFLWTSKTDFLDCTEAELNQLILDYPAAISPKILFKKYQYIQYENPVSDNINLWINNNLTLSMLLHTKEDDLLHSLTQYHVLQPKVQLLNSNVNPSQESIEEIIELAQAEAKFEDEYKEKMKLEASQSPITPMPGLSFDPPIFKDEQADLGDSLNNATISNLIKQDIASEDYFSSQGIKVKKEFPETIPELKKPPKNNHSFLGWLQTMSSKPNGNNTENNNVHKNSRKEVSHKSTTNFEPAPNFSKVAPTETMAIILEQQGKFNQAIEIYLKLSAEIPEKSCYFAEKIKQINNLNS